MGAGGALQKPVGVHQFGNHVIFGFIIGRVSFALREFDGFVLVHGFVRLDERIRSAAAMLVSGPPVGVCYANISLHCGMKWLFPAIVTGPVDLFVSDLTASELINSFSI